MTRTYSELARIHDFEERFRYLALRGVVGGATFGHERHMNQRFYRSRQWQQLRDFVIVRDNGCDLGVDGYEIHTGLYIHHMNPMTPDDIRHGNDDILDPEFMITTTFRTHQAIHYGDERQLPRPFVPRARNDTAPWRR
jgi:hypothetical protein